MTASVILVLALITWAVVAAVRGLGRGPQADSWPTAKAVLAERFARGEIDEQEYRRRLDVLDGSRTDTRP